MKDIIKRTIELRSRCDKLSADLQRKYGENDPRTDCVNMIFNQTTMTIELLSYFHKIWSQNYQLSTTKREQLKSDNASRIAEATKSMFISSMSSIEFCMKKTIELYPDSKLSDSIKRKEKLFSEFELVFNTLDETEKAKLRKFRRQLKDVPPFDSFGRIILKSHSIGLIDDKAKETWSFLTEVRNISVHNNGIASRNRQLIIDGRKFQMIEGKMLRDKLDFYLVLSEQAVDCFYQWALALRNEGS